MMAEQLTPERLAGLRRTAEAATPEARDDGRASGITVAVNHPSDPGNIVEVDYGKYREQLDRGEPLSLEQASVLLELWRDGVRRFFREHEAWHRENDRAEKSEVEAGRWRKKYEELRAEVERVVQHLYERTRATARDWRQSGHPYHDGASDAYCEAFLVVRRVLGEAGGGGDGPCRQDQEATP